MESSICNTHVTGEILKRLLLKSKAINIGNHDLTSVQGELVGNQGETSNVLRVFLTWTPANDDQLPKSVIVKAIGSDAVNDYFDSSVQGELDQLRHQMRMMNDIECSFYRIPGVFDAVQMPRPYAATMLSEEDGGIIILEDLTDLGSNIPRHIVFSSGLNWNQLENLLEATASLHAWSINTQIDWQNRLPKLAENPVVGTFAESLFLAFPKAKEEYPEVFSKVDEQKLQEFMTVKKYLELFGSDPRVRYGLPLVLVHGDLLSKNVLFEKMSQNDQVGDKVVALFDWQLAHPGCAAEDVAIIFGWSFTPEVRRNQGDEIISRYVQLFNSKVINPEKRIEFGPFKHAVHEMFAYAGVIYGCAISSAASSAMSITGITEEERQVIMNNITRMDGENFLDSIEILDLKRTD